MSKDTRIVRNTKLAKMLAGLKPFVVLPEQKPEFKAGYNSSLQESLKLSAAVNQVRNDAWELKEGRPIEDLP